MDDDEEEEVEKDKWHKKKKRRRRRKASNSAGKSWKKSRKENTARAERGRASEDSARGGPAAERDSGERRLLVIYPNTA